MTGRSVLDRSAFPVLVVAGAERERLAGETLRRIVAELGALGHDIVRSSSITDAAALVASDPSFGCLLLDWNLEHEGGGRPALAVFDQVRRHNVRVPVFLMVERDDLDDIPLAVQEAVQEFVLVFEDTPSFVAGRIDYAWRRHTENLLPPFFRTLVHFTESHEYSWHTPGHAGDGVPQVTGRQGLLRLLRRDPVPHRPVRLGRRARLTARPLRGRRGGGAQRRQGLRGRRHLLRAERDLDLEPDRRPCLRRGR